MPDGVPGAEVGTNLIDGHLGNDPSPDDLYEAQRLAPT